MTKTLKIILAVLGVFIIAGAAFLIGRSGQDTQPSTVQHDYPLTITVLVSGDFSCVLTPATLSLHKGETGTVEITNTASGGFDAKIHYLLSGLPAEAYSFSVNPVDPGQATTLTINTSALQSNATYACVISAGDTGTVIIED